MNKHIVSGKISIRYKSTDEMKKISMWVFDAIPEFNLSGITTASVKPEFVEIHIKASHEDMNSEEYWNLESFVMELTSVFKTQAQLALSYDRNVVARVIEIGGVTHDFKTGEDLDRLLSMAESFHYLQSNLEKVAKGKELPEHGYDSINWNIENNESFRDWFIRSNFYQKTKTALPPLIEFSEFVDTIREKKGEIED